MNSGPSTNWIQPTLFQPQDQSLPSGTEKRGCVGRPRQRHQPAVESCLLIEVGKACYRRLAGQHPTTLSGRTDARVHPHRKVEIPFPGSEISNISTHRHCCEKTVPQAPSSPSAFCIFRLLVLICPTYSPASMLCCFSMSKQINFYWGHMPRKL